MVLVVVALVGVVDVPGFAVVLVRVTLVLVVVVPVVLMVVALVGIVNVARSAVVLVRVTFVLVVRHGDPPSNKKYVMI